MIIYIKNNNRKEYKNNFLNYCDWTLGLIKSYFINDDDNDNNNKNKKKNKK
jgi:hypothetical protein